MKLRISVVLALALLLNVATVAQTTQNLNDQLWEAARTGDAKAAGELITKGADVNARFRYGQTPIFKAAERGHTDVVKILLEKGADVNVRDTFYGATALTWAADKGHIEVVRALLARGIKGGVEEVLLGGVGQGNIELVKVALAQGGLSAETLSAALAAATRQNKTEIVELLKQAGAQPPPKADFPVPMETLKSYEGAYKPDAGADVTIAVNKDGKLTATTSGQTFVLGAFDNLRFRPIEAEGVTLTFSVEGGKVTSFTLKQGASTQVYKKVEK